MRMSIEEEVQLLRTVDILEPLSDEGETRWLVSVRTTISRQARSSTPPMTPARSLHPQEGAGADLHGHGRAGVTQAIVEAGTVFGEMALTAQQLQGAYAQAMEASILIAMSREELEQLILQKPEVGFT